MRILHLCHQSLPETRGGVEAYVQDLVSAQAAAGHDVAILSGSHQPWPRVGIEAQRLGDVPLHRLHRDDLYFDLYSKGWHPGVEAQLTSFLQAAPPDVVHVHQWIRLTTNLVEIVQRLGLPAVVTLHDYYLSCPRAFRLKPEGDPCFAPLRPEHCRSCAPRYGHESPAEVDAALELFRQQSCAELAMADAVLVGVASTADLLAKTLAMPRERFQVQSLGYRRRFPGLGPLPAPDAAAPLRFGFWGGVAEHKGIRVLLAAFRALCAVRPARAVELHVLGGIATKALEVELRAAATGLPVTFHGRFETEVLRTLGLAVGVFPSTCLETFGIVLDECVELGLPAVVADLGALGVRIGDGGLKVPAGDAEALAKAMQRFVDEPGLWASLRARLPALPPDLSTHVAELGAIYRTAIARRRAAGPVTGGVPVAARAALLRQQLESALARLPFRGDG